MRGLMLFVTEGGFAVRQHLERMVIMRRLVFCALLLSSALICSGSIVLSQEKQPAPDELVSDIAGDDPVRSASALKYIEEKKPGTLPDLFEPLLLDSSSIQAKQRILAALQKYPYPQVLKTYFNVLEKSQSFIIKKEIITILGKTNDRSIVIPVSKELESPFFAVRESAILALKEIGDDRMFPVIFRMAESRDPVLRVYALESLYHLYDIRLFSIIQTLVQDENKSVRILALQCIEKNALDKLLPNIRNIALADANWEVRIEAIQTLGRMNDAGCLYVLLKTLVCDNRDIRLATSAVLQKFKMRQSAYYISEQLAAETDNAVKSVLLDTLIDMRDSGSYRGFEKMLSDEPNVTLRIRAAYGLGIIGGNRGLQILHKALKDADYRVRGEACGSLGALREKYSTQALVLLIKDDNDRYVRLAALYALERIRDKSSIIPLYDIYAAEKDPVFKVKIFEITRLLIQYSI